MALEHPLSHLPEALLECSTDTILAYLCLKEAAGPDGLVDAMYYVIGFSGMGRKRMLKAATELEGRGLVRVVDRPGYYGTRKGCVLSAICPPVRHDRLPQTAWAQIRSEVFRRDDFTCQYCGERGGKLECDHIEPLSRGGTNELGNLTTACADCNRSKRAKSLTDWHGRKALQ